MFGDSSPRIFVQDETKHFSREACWDRWVIVMKIIVCLFPFPTLEGYLCAS